MNEALKRALLEQQREQNRIFRQITVLREAEETIDRLENLGFDISWISNGYYDNPSWIECHVTTSAFLADEAPELMETLELLDNLFPDAEVISFDDPKNAKREYLFSGSVRFNLIATLTDDATCKVKVVGTKKVEKSVYVEVDEPAYSFEC